jgi:hypothetical protein
MTVAVRLAEAPGHWYRLTPRLPATVALNRVRVAEDPTLYADCTGLA